MAVEKRYIPRDIIRDILLLQPSKSLQRFKTVCKSWNAIISDHDFARYHLQQSKRNHNILLWKGWKEISIAKFENGKFQVEERCDKPNDCKILLCSGDGLALFGTSCPKSYVLWNPCSKQKTTITRSYRFNLQRTIFGISRGPNWDDYKIVALNRYNCAYFVFSCKNGSWSKKKKLPFIISEKTIKGGLFAGGFCFWAMKEFGCYMPQIFYFDPRDEEFKKLQQPMEVNQMVRIRDIYLTSFRGCLCFFDNINLIRMAEQVQLRCWILRDNDVDSSSWSELMVINDVVDNGLVPVKVITRLFSADKKEQVIRLDMEKKHEVLFDDCQNI